MINNLKKIVFSIWLIQVLLLQISKAQFINLQITIEPELSATVEKNLNFGTLISGSGYQEIKLGDINMGVFSITALNTQNIYIDLEYPEALESSDPSIDASIPLDLKLAYNNSGEDNPIESLLLENHYGFIPIHIENGKSISEQATWQRLFLYVFGSITINDIPNGVYEGNITLLVEYD